MGAFVSKGKDLTGQKLGRLRVAGLIGSTGNRNLWHVYCDCGGEDMKTSKQLSKAKGCTKCARIKDLLVGQTFGELTVLYLKGTNEHGKSVWACRCSCGLETEAIGGDLKSGNRKSCGCLQVKHLQSTTETYLRWKSFHRTNQVPDAWHEYRNFLADLGEVPDENHMLSRRDGTKPHGPKNTYWRDAQDEQNLTAQDLGEDFVLDLRSFALAEASARARASAT